MRGARVSQTSPRGTYLIISESLRAQITADEAMTHLPTLSEVMRENAVSRGVALRAYAVLRTEGLAEPVPGGRWRVVRPGLEEDRRSLADRIADIITDAGLQVGSPFPSTTELASRFGASRPTVSKALDKLESAGLLSEARQGKQRTVRALPTRTELPRS
ncbi:GntR family transcriptional regulator [[Kitasatospora] papulosa]|uniref:GntR family transcriptional regulator n=1 Tax=[Kitasatospora] papulosa TaxID=1464011 RepID=UPI0036849147